MISLTLPIFTSKPYKLLYQFSLGKLITALSRAEISTVYDYALSFFSRLKHLIILVPLILLIWSPFWCFEMKQNKHISFWFLETFRWPPFKKEDRLILTSGLIQFYKNYEKLNIIKFLWTVPQSVLYLPRFLLKK